MFKKYNKKFANLLPLIKKRINIITKKEFPIFLEFNALL